MRVIRRFKAAGAVIHKVSEELGGVWAAMWLAVVG